MSIEEDRKIAFDASPAMHFVQSWTKVARNDIGAPISPGENIIVFVFQDEAVTTYGVQSHQGPEKYARDVEELRAVKERLEAAGEAFRRVGVSEIPDRPEGLQGPITGGAFPTDVAEYYGGTRPMGSGTSFGFNMNLFSNHLRLTDREVPGGTPRPFRVVLCVDISGSMTRVDIEPGFTIDDANGDNLVQWIRDTHGMEVSVVFYNDERWPRFAAQRFG